MRIALAISLAIVSLSLCAQGPYAPEVGVNGTTAMHKDSSAFVAWAQRGNLHRGVLDIANPNSDTASVGQIDNAFNKADGLVVSFGDGGEATLQADGLIYNGPGPDFAIFENAFNSSFLELAFVEVSSDGINFYRFPSHSLTDTVNQVGSFGAVDPTHLYNLAGKYQANYGTPFDLEEMRNISGLDVNSISHVKVIDVIGSLDQNHAQRDSQGRKINDPYPTAFASGGFDLDAMGIVYLKGVGLEELQVEQLSIYPNPSSSLVHFPQKWSTANVLIHSMDGKVLFNSYLAENSLNISFLPKGIYQVSLTKREKQGRVKLIVQ